MNSKDKIVTNNINELKILPDVGINTNQNAFCNNFAFLLFVIIKRKNWRRKLGMELVRDKFNFYK